MRNNTIIMLICFGAITIGIAFNGYATEARTNVDVVNEKTKAAIEEIKNYTADKKDAAIEKSKEIIADFDSRIKTLEDSIADKKGDLSDVVREKKVKIIAKLKKNRIDVQKWYDKLRDSTADAWDEVKKGFIKAYDAFQDSYKDA